jgi:hypothetical protein
MTGSLGVIFGVIIGYASIPTTALVPAKKPEAPVVIEPTPTPPVQETKLVTIVTDPAGARVIAPNGTSLGVTPIEIPISGVSTYLIMRDDGANAAVTLSEEKDAGRTVEVSLAPPVAVTPEKRDEPVKVVAPKPEKRPAKKVDNKKKKQR